jgi:hypothetical protein
MEVSSRLHDPSVLPRARILLCPSGRRLSGPRDFLGAMEKRKRLHCWESNPILPAPGDRPSRGHWRGDWVGPRDFLGAMKKRKRLHCWEWNTRLKLSIIYINKNVNVRLCKILKRVQKRKSPKVVHRWLCNFDTTLQSNTSVFLYTCYIYRLYI